MKLYFVRDEQDRVNRQFATKEKPDGVVYIDTFSYLHIRKMFNDQGDVMALDTITSKLQDLLIIKNGY